MLYGRQIIFRAKLFREMPVAVYDGIHIVGREILAALCSIVLARYV